MRSFIDDADLLVQVAKGYPLPSTTTDYGFAEPRRVSIGALVATLGNNYSVPIEHVGAPVTVRVHPERPVIWRDAERLAEHARAPDGAHRRIIQAHRLSPGPMTVLARQRQAGHRHAASTTPTCWCRWPKAIRCRPRPPTMASPSQAG